MTYDDSYPFINETLSGKKKENVKNSEETNIQLNKLKEQCSRLAAEKKMLEEKRDTLKRQVLNRTRTEDEIRDTLFKSFMNAIWSVYKSSEANHRMEENMRQKEETYEQEYSQLMNEIASLLKDKNGTTPIFNKDQR